MTNLLCSFFEHSHFFVPTLLNCCDQVSKSIVDGIKWSQGFFFMSLCIYEYIITMNTFTTYGVHLCYGNYKAYYTPSKACTLLVIDTLQRPYDSHPTEHLTVSEPKNPLIEVFELHKICQSSDYEALKL